MTAWVMRVLFLLACAGIGLKFSGDDNHLMGILIGLACAVVIIALEFVLSKRPIQSISAIVFGLITGCHHGDPFQLHSAVGQRPAASAA